MIVFKTGFHCVVAGVPEMSPGFRQVHTAPLKPVHPLDLFSCGNSWASQQEFGQVGEEFLNTSHLNVKAPFVGEAQRGLVSFLRSHSQFLDMHANEGFRINLPVRFYCGI